MGRLNKNKGLVVSGSNVALKNNKPKVGISGLQSKFAQLFKVNNSNMVGELAQGSSMGFEQVIVSDKLKSKSHATVRFMDKDKVLSNAKKEKDIFLFGNFSRKNNQLRSSSLSDLSKIGIPSDLVDIGTTMDGISMSWRLIQILRFY